MHDLWGMYRLERESLESLSGSSGTKVCGYTCRTIRILFQQTGNERKREAPFNIPRPRVFHPRVHAGCDLSLTVPDGRSIPSYLQENYFSRYTFVYVVFVDARVPQEPCIILKDRARGRP